MIILEPIDRDQIAPYFQKDREVRYLHFQSGHFPDIHHHLYIRWVNGNVWAVYCPESSSAPYRFRFDGEIMSYRLNDYTEAHAKRWFPVQAMAASL